VLDRRKGIVEMMQQALPLLIQGGTAKSDRVGFEGLPLHEQDVAGRDFEAPLQLMRQVTGSRHENWRCLAERSFKGCLTPRADIENGDLQDHMHSERPNG
jgi:hypothetical protein